MECFKKDTCVNYKIRCFNCGAMSDMTNPYPRYSNKIDHKNKLMDLLNKNPELLDGANRFPWKKVNLVDYLVEHGVRVEED